jgi:hypothetical protein
MQFRQGIGRFGAVDVVNLPKFYAIAPGGKFSGDHRSMFSLFHSHDPLGSLEIVFGQFNRKANVVWQMDSTFGKARSGMNGNRANVISTDVECPRFRLPGNSALGRQRIEDNFRVPAAIVIAAAKKQNRVHVLIPDFLDNENSLRRPCPIQMKIDHQGKMVARALSQVIPYHARRAHFNGPPIKRFV